MNEILRQSASPLRDEGDTATSNYKHAHCHKCNSTRVLEKGVCTYCQTIINPQQPFAQPKVHSIVHNPNSKSLTPDQVEGFDETNNLLKIVRDEHEYTSDEYDDDEDRAQLRGDNDDNDIDMYDEGDITSNLASSSRSTPPPSFRMSPKKRSSKNDNNRSKRDRKNRSKKKRKAHPNNFHNVQKRKRIKIEKILQINKKNKMNPIELLSDEDESTSISNVSLNAGDKNNPIYISDNDDDEFQPDFPMPPSPNKERRIKQEQSDEKAYELFNDAISEMSSDSLSVCSGVGRMTIRLGDKDRRSVRLDDEMEPAPMTEAEKVLNAWKNEINPKELTLKGLSMIRNVKMPRAECKKLISCIREGFKHVIGASIPYNERLIAMVVGLLEAMDVKERTDQSYADWNNTNRKPQVLLVAPRKHMALAARKMFLEIGQFWELYAQTLIGGMPSYQCIRRLRGGLDVITGTPGKLCDMVEKGVLNAHMLNNLTVFAMDGADELTSSHSMRRQMQLIISAFPKRRVRVLTLESYQSAYSKQSLTRFVRNCDPSIKNMQDEHDNIASIDNNLSFIQKMRHIESFVDNSSYYRKRDALEQILRYYRGDNIIVFFNSKHSLRVNFDRVETVRPRSMLYILDKDFNNEERRHIVENFRRNGGVLFSTDLISCGMMFKVPIIVNFDVPNFDPIKSYIKRCSVSESKHVSVVSIVNERGQRGRVNGGRYGRYYTTDGDMKNMDRIKGRIQCQFDNFYDWSADRRRDKSIREQSICRN